MNKITNNYDTVIRVQRLIIDILAHNNNYDAFVETFDISNILTNPSLQFVSDALKALLLRNASKTIQRKLYHSCQKIILNRSFQVSQSSSDLIYYKFICLQNQENFNPGRCFQQN